MLGLIAARSENRGSASWLSASEEMVGNHVSNALGRSQVIGLVRAVICARKAGMRAEPGG